MKIQPIVEGHGEVEAVPILLRRLLHNAGVFDVEIAPPIRQKQSHLIQRDGIKKAVALAKRQTDCSAIFILFESEDSCPKALAPRILNWALEETAGIPCVIVLAHREYEAWFLASIESLRGYAVKNDASFNSDPESVRGAKEKLSDLMSGKGYIETIHQPAFTAKFNMQSAFSKCRSFKKLVKAMGEILSAINKLPVIWPPSLSS